VVDCKVGTARLLMTDAIWQINENKAILNKTLKMSESHETITIGSVDDW